MALDVFPESIQLILFKSTDTVSLANEAAELNENNWQKQQHTEDAQLSQND